MDIYEVEYLPISGKYALKRNDRVIVTRMRQFRKAFWNTKAGAQRAADALNAANNRA